MGTIIAVVEPDPCRIRFSFQDDCGSWKLCRHLGFPCVAVCFAVVVIGALFLYIGPELTVETGGLGKVSSLWSRVSRMLGMLVIACLMLFPGPISGRALQQAETQTGDLQIEISLDSKTVKTGDSIEFDTVVTNVGTQNSSPVIAAMNIINLSKEGDVVDPEDWSPERTQYIDALTPSEATTLSWQVNAVLDGNYMVYIVGVPEPASAETSSQAVASRGLHLNVTRFTSLNPAGVVPYAVGVPLFVVVAMFLLFRLRRRQIDTGAAGELPAG